MGTPPLNPDHPRWPDVIRAVSMVEQGKTKTEAAEALGVPFATLQNWFKAYDRHNLPTGIQDALSQTGVSADHAKFGYRRVQDEDGNFNTVFWRLPSEEDKCVFDRIREAVEGIAPVSPIPPQEDHDSDLLTLYPIADMHIGMMAWWQETGENYDTKKASRRLIEWAGQCISSSPKSETGVVLLNGDTLHADDATNSTPKSKHVLDVDTRFFKTIDMTVLAIGTVVDLALQQHATVHLVVKPGNHDPHAYLAILFAMAERYREESRVVIEKNPSEFWAMQFGKVMLAAHHGHRSKASQMVLYLADQFPGMWGGTKFRYLWTGHLHHHKSQEIGGMVWEQSRAGAPKDAWAAAGAYSSRSEIQGITYHRARGEVSRVRVAA